MLVYMASYSPKLSRIEPVWNKERVMMVPFHKMIASLGMVGVWMCHSTGWCRSQGSDNKAVHSSKPSGNSVRRIDPAAFIYPYFEWVTKDTALAWVRKPDGSAVAIPLTGEHREELRISGASDVKNMGLCRPYGMKMSPDGSKMLFLMSGPGAPSVSWRVGTLNGTKYTTGKTPVYAQTPDLVWTRDSKEWVAIQNGILSFAVIHYYADGERPSLSVQTKDAPPVLPGAKMEFSDILGLGQDGIAIVTRKHTDTVDLYLVDIGTGRVLPERHKVILPAGAQVRGMTLSHSGDHIAWVFTMKFVRVTDGMFQEDYVQDVWLSNSDGSDLKRLPGFPPHRVEPLLPFQKYARVFVDFPIRWTLDDSAVSYMQGDGIQLVKVN
jgi:hypothetical protein